MKDQLRTRKIDYADINQPDQQNNPDHIVVKGMPPSGRSDLLTIVHDRLPDYDVTGGPDNSWNLAMRLSSLNELKNQAVTQAIDTIRNRIDALGRQRAHHRAARTRGNTRFWCSFLAWMIPAA